MADQNVIAMEGGAFAEWAEREFGVDYDDVRFWDTARDLNSVARMPEGFEVNSEGVIPADLYDLLIARKEHRNPSFVARADARAAGEQEARAIVAKPEPWSRDDWKRLADLGFATRYTEDGGEQGYMSTSYSLTERGEQLNNPAYRARGLYDDQYDL